MTNLYILGPAEIRNPQGELEHSFLAGPKRLALLTYLLLNKPRGFHRRDSLLPLFWPEQDQKGARNALSNMLYHIRQTLGRDAIENRGFEEITLNPETFWCDAIAFEQAVKEKDLSKALQLYRSDLLKGFYVQDISSEFDHWLEEERLKFHSVALEESLKLSERALSKRDFTEAKRWAKYAAKLDPYTEAVHLNLISVLHKIGDRTSAISAYKSFASRILAEFDEDPGKEMEVLIEEVKSGDSAPKPSEKISVKKNKSQTSIAVLPFETLGLDKASAFTDAIHGDILTRLSQVSDLSVISRTSVVSYKNTWKLIAEIAAELQVDWIMTGEVQEIGNQVKVSVRLVNAAEDRQVWAEIFQRKLTADELFIIQAEITQKIIEALKMRLSSKEKTAIKQIPTENLEAFRMHAYGCWNLDQRTEKGMLMAEDYFRQALSHDSGYAQAWMGLADALILRHDYGHESGGSILPEAEEAAKKALQLDPEMAEAYASIGLHYTTRRNADAAIKNLKKSIKLKPGYANAHAWLSWIFQLTGKAKESLECAQTAVKQNPLSQESISNLSLAWLTNEEYLKSLLEARRLLQIQPDFTSAKFQEGLALYHLGKFEEADEVLQDLSVPWAGNGPLVTQILCCLKTGKLEKAEHLLSAVADDQFGECLILSAKGEHEKSFQKMKEFNQWNYWELISIYHLYPDLLDPIRSHKGFDEIMEKVNGSWGLKIGNKNSYGNIRTSEDNKEKEKIAILPFKDLDSLEPKFTDGIHGDIVSSLSRIKNLQVISRTSVLHYKDSKKGIEEIKDELKVDWILTGEVLQNSDSITVDVSLINTASCKVIWKNLFFQKLTAENIFLVQQKIINGLLKNFEIEVTTKEEQRVTQKPTDNLNAYRLYSQGRNCLDLRTESGIYRGLDCFQGSIELDPDYALAWSGLADALSLLQYYGFSIPKSSLDPMEAAKRSVDLDPELGEAYCSLGIVYSNNQDGPEALKEFKQAIKFTPGYAEALVWLGWINLILGTPEEALEPSQKGARLDPLAPAVRVYLAEAYLANRMIPQALAEAKRAREINPEYGLTHFMEGIILYHCGKFKEAVSAFDKALSLIPVRGTPSQSEVKTALAFAHHALGNVEYAHQFKSEIYSWIDPFSLAMLQVLSGELDEAFLTFNKVKDWTSVSTNQIRYFFPLELSPVRADERYEQLINKVNFSWKMPESSRISR